MSLPVDFLSKFRYVQVDGDSSTNDTLLAFANGAAGGKLISDLDSKEAKELQAALDTVFSLCSSSMFFVGLGPSVCVICLPKPRG